MRKERIGEPVNEGRNWAAAKKEFLSDYFKISDRKGCRRDLAKQSFRRTNNYPGKRKPIREGGRGEGESGVSCGRGPLFCSLQLGEGGVLRLAVQMPRLSRLRLRAKWGPFQSGRRKGMNARWVFGDDGKSPPSPVGRGGELARGGGALTMAGACAAAVPGDARTSIVGTTWPLALCSPGPPPPPPPPGIGEDGDGGSRLGLSNGGGRSVPWSCPTAARASPSSAPPRKAKEEPGRGRDRLSPEIPPPPWPLSALQGSPRAGPPSLPRSSPSWRPDAARCPDAAAAGVLHGCFGSRSGSSRDALASCQDCAPPCLDRDACVVIAIVGLISWDAAKSGFPRTAPKSCLANRNLFRRSRNTRQLSAVWVFFFTGATLNIHFPHAGRLGTSLSSTSPSPEIQTSSPTSFYPELC